MKNDNHRNKILSKLTNPRGFNPPFNKGLLNLSTGSGSPKKKLDFSTLYHKVSRFNSQEKKFEIKDVFEEYANKKSIKDITEEMMSSLERDIANISY